jgi:uncharacterized membrane protein (Fun14 family)
MEIVTPFVLGMILGGALKRPLEGLLTAVLFMGALWAALNPEAARGLLEGYLGRVDAIAAQVAGWAQTIAQGRLPAIPLQTVFMAGLLLGMRVG